jgi:hypothetical protein
MLKEIVRVVCACTLSLIVVPLVVNAQSWDLELTYADTSTMHYPTELKSIIDINDVRPLNSSDKKVILLIHGYNPSGTHDPYGFNWYNVDYQEEFQNLVI